LLPALGPRVVSCVYWTPGISLIRSRYSWPTGTLLICSLEIPLVIAADVLSMSAAVAVTVTASVTPLTVSAASAVVMSDSWTSALRVAVVIPSSVKVSVYSPGGRAGNWNVPSAAVTVTRGPGRTDARASTVTPGSTPPPVSVTLPWMDPVC
jgi:hypothetical protein